MDTILTTTGHVSPLAQLVVFFYKLLGVQSGLDSSVVLVIVGFVWGGLNIVSPIVSRIINNHFMCTVLVHGYDPIYLHLKELLSDPRILPDGRYFMVETNWKSASEEEKELGDVSSLTDGGEENYLNFANQASKSRPRFVPIGTTSFWHRGNYFYLQWEKRSFINAAQSEGPIQDVEKVVISCFGRSMGPINMLLADAKALYYRDTGQKTTIYSPRPKEQRRANCMWQPGTRRPVRPMSTVVLAAKDKEAILKDVNEYLHPQTQQWYADRGIPWRRGYLFHGPPGTGKTSFSFALAGFFGIDIYVISLQDPGINEDALAALFADLPRRCIVLLEDIDSAGLRRNLSSESDEETEDNKREAKGKQEKNKKHEGASDTTDGESEDEIKARPKKRAAKKRYVRKNNPEAVDGISMSGLLNVIDGVASHEGRVLIMTTNKPESLDEALTRAGRVDMRVKFSNASSKQAGELFYRMYETLRHKETTKKAMEDGPADKSKDRPMANHDDEKPEDITAEEMRDMSEKFGSQIPEGVFSPANIQGFLLRHKKSPRRALNEVPEWVNKDES
ncbi:BCS1 N terminal domain-containing protein [Trichoderma velutinum]